MWADSQQRAHEVHWPEVDGLFTSLPPHLFRQAKLLEYDLALRYSDSGQFRDIHRGADQFPILSIAGWVIADLGLPAGVDRADAERRLFLVQLLLAARTQVLEGIGDPSSFSDERQFALAEFCTTRIGRELARLIPAGSAFWDEFDAVVTDQLDRLVERHERESAADLYDEPAAYLHGRWSAPAKVVALAATSVAGATNVGPAVAGMLASLADAFQVRDEVATLHRDLQQGRITYPIAIVAQAADIPLRPAPDPHRVLGAMVATRSLPTILHVPVTIVEACRRSALELGLPTLASYLAAAGARFAEDADRLSETSATRPGSTSPRPPPSDPLLLRFEPTVPQALDMAERFLLADKTFRESWETHREGMFGAAEVWSRFPAGLIIEILQRRGHDVSGDIDEFLAKTAGNGFRYYEHPWSDADSDTVGVFLRLRPHATTPDAYAQATAHVLDSLDRLVTPALGIPVWIADAGATYEARPPVMALGEGCATVAAHLLLGLAPEAGDRYRRTVQSGAAHLLDRLSDVGVAANVNYPPLYAIGIFCRLLAALDVGAHAGPLAEQIGRARQKLLADLDARLARVASPQDSALAAIACRTAGQTDLINSRWLTTILKHQRADGSWTSEPFAAAPNRGGWVSWYSSTTLTSALCYDALAASD